MKNGVGSLLQGFAWAGIGRIAALACGFLLTMILARGLSPSENGQYFVAFSAVVILSSVGAIGFDYMVVRFAAIHLLDSADRSVYVILVKCAAAVAVASLLLSALLVSGGSHLQEVAGGSVSLGSYSWAMAAWIFFAIMQRQLAESFRGLGDVRAATILGGLRNNGILNALLCCAAMAGLLVTGRLTIATAIAAMACASALVCLVAIGLFWQDLKRRAPAGVRPTTFRLRPALAHGWPVWLATLVSAVNYMGSTWLVEAFDDTANVALFGVAQRLVLILMAPMMVINSVLPPVIAQLHAEGKSKDLERLVRTSSGFGLLIALAALLAIVLVGKPLLAIAFGAFYDGAHAILILLCLAQVIGIALGAWQVVLPMTGGSRQMLVTSAVAVVSQIGFGLLLGRHGVIGISIAVGMSVLVSNFVGMYFVRRTVGISTVARLDASVLVEAVRRIRRKAVSRYHLSISSACPSYSHFLRHWPIAHR